MGGIYMALAGACTAEQVYNDFDAEVLMEIRASAESVDKLLNQYPDDSYLLFPEDRKNPIRLLDGLPECWVERGPSVQFDGQANPGEFYTFQIGVYSARKSIADIAVEYSDFKGTNGKVICASELRCFNLRGIDCLGQPLTKVVSVPQGHVQPLWFGVQIPKDAQGRYEGTLTIEPRGCKPTKLKLALTISGPVLEDAGDSELWRHSRLRWLDSTIAIDDEVTAPYLPLEVCGNAVQCLGRKVILNDTGLPENIISFFSPAAVGRIERRGRELFAAPINFVIETSSGCIKWTGNKVLFLSQKPGSVEWQSSSKGDGFILNCRAVMEFDGHITYELILKAQRPTQVKDIRLEIPFRRDVVKYLMGMGHKGGYRPKGFFWKWNSELNQDSVWIGDVSGGLQCKLKGPNYRRPVFNQYKYGPLNIPPDWDNDGKGGCRLDEAGDDRVVLRAYSGPRSIAADEQLHFYFDLLITPLKPVEVAKHWNTRLYHVISLYEAVKWGVNTIIVHHGADGGDFNPYINYPFYPEAVKDLASYIKEVHQKGFRAIIYYTVRELSNHTVELWALRSLGDEILVSGKNVHGDSCPGGDAWLRKHLQTNYAPGWKRVVYSGKYKGQADVSILNNGMSRWNNYYLEGLKWLIDNNVEIDGLFIDCVGYDRKVMQRVRKVLDRNRLGSLINMHSSNHFNDWQGWANSANVYMELFPYMDSIFYGERFDCNQSPDFWLIESTGIPYGLTGETPQDNDNPWRGMIYGMTSHPPYWGNPVHIWKFWDEFGIQDSEMIGYWSPNCPVKTSHKDILATVYRKKDKTLVSVASWANETVDVTLQIDWKALGIEPSKARLYVPAIPDFQDEAVYNTTDSITIQAGKGYLIIIEGKSVI